MRDFDGPACRQCDASFPISKSRLEIGEHEHLYDTGQSIHLFLLVVIADIWAHFPMLPEDLLFSSPGGP